MRIEIVDARDGHRVPKVITESSTINMGRLYDGKRAASLWVDNNINENLVKRSDHLNIILFGIRYSVGTFSTPKSRIKKSLITKSK